MDNIPLPKSGKEWNDQFGESEQIPSENIWINEGCDHYFELIRAGEIQCRNCYWGLYISRHDSVTDGHLFKGDKKII